VSSGGQGAGRTARRRWRQPARSVRWIQPCASAAGRPEGDKGSVTEIEADEVGASLKWATAKVERASQRGDDDRTQGRERQTERGDFNDQPPC
jgi:hypothetical protein